MNAAPFAAPNKTKSDWRHAFRLITPGFRIRDERPVDAPAREALLDAAFGPGRFAKTCERLREGRLAAEGLSFVATDGSETVGTVRLWDIEIGSRASLMLGPLAVSTAKRSAGIGGALMEHALRRARKLGHDSVILVGDAPYYARWGFDAALTDGFVLPGPVERARFLGLELVPGTLQGVGGRIVGAGPFTDSRTGGDAERRAA
jgi:predicted N-acetyltransferase YhbS